MEGRAICIVFFTSVLISTLGPANGKPFFGPLWCEMMCEDDGTGTTATSTEFFDLLFDPCIACPDTNTTSVRPTNPTPPTGQPPMNFMLAPTAAGMNLTMEMRDGRWVISVLPSPTPNQAPNPNTATTTAAPTTTAASTTAGSTTAATTTTTAAGSTTAGTTTAATTTTKKA